MTPAPGFLILAATITAVMAIETLASNAAGTQHPQAGEASQVNQLIVKGGQ